MTVSDLLDVIRSTRQTGQNEAAIDAIRRLMAMQPKLGAGWEEVLNHALGTADEDIALDIAKALQAELPKDPKPVLILAERFSRVGRSDTALQLVDRLKTLAPPNPALDYFHGVYSGHLGKIDDARYDFRRAIGRKPDFGDAWAMLAASGGVEGKDAQALELLVNSRGGHGMPGAAYALGALRHTQDDPDAAWQAWEAANASAREGKPFNRAGELAAMQDIEAGDQEIPDPIPPYRAVAEGARPIFIVGPPRSGTSLTEQIIAATPGTRALGETLLSRISTWPLGNLTRPAMQAAGAFQEGGVDWGQMGDIYRHLSSLRSEGAPVITDKGALLHLFVGVLARMLPDAKFVWVKRDPRDVAFSAWRAHFTDGNRWRHDFADSAAYLAGHEKLMTYWEARLGDRLYRLEYETLVRDPQPAVDKLLDFLDLPQIRLETADFSGASVPTASFAQIRGKITPKSVGSWQPYAERITPHFGKA